AQNAAAKTRGYNSAATRAEMEEAFAKATGGKRPYPWQLDVAEAMMLGVDSVVIAGT
ncbi:hypothetical protein BV20DRAFT_920088, partial [Pilatotrama ljubarskyi]